MVWARCCRRVYPHHRNHMGEGVSREKGYGEGRSGSFARPPSCTPNFCWRGRGCVSESELNKGPPELAQLSFTGVGVVHIGARALHVLNL
jgi:hypothetical protein